MSLFSLQGRLLLRIASLCCSGTQPGAPTDWWEQRGAAGVSPLIPGVPHFPRHATKCTSWFLAVWERDTQLARSERLALPGHIHFLNAGLGGSMHRVSVQTAPHADIHPRTGKEGGKMVSVTPCNPLQDADDLKQLEWEFSYYRFLKRLRSSPT